MNLYKLFTSEGSQYWALALCSHVAIAKIENLSGERVSCWFIGGVVPAGLPVYRT